MMIHQVELVDRTESAAMMCPERLSGVHWSQKDKLAVACLAGHSLLCC